MNTDKLRIGVISDTHVVELQELPASLLEALKGVDMIVHLGDYTGKGLLNGLRNLGSFHGVSGNMDPLSVRVELPEREILDVGGKRIGLTHGSGSPWDLVARVRKQFQDVDAILYGHSHLSCSEMIEGVLCLNPGSATGRFPAPGKTFGILTVGDDIKGEIVAL
ncbi:MAG: metallophosphoesterase family protein [Chloroflexota bacterium]